MMFKRLPLRTRVAARAAVRHGKSAVATIAAALAAAATFSGAAHADVLNFQMRLDAPQENNNIPSTGTGSGTATLDTTTNMFSWNITFSGLTSAEAAAHFHGAAPQCMNAGVLIPLPLGSPKIGSQTVTAQQADDIIDGLWYVNVHSSNHPTGEIRGQVLPTPLDNPIEDLIPPGTIHLQLDTVATGLTAPNWGTFAPGVPGRLFVTDQQGIIWNINLATGTKSMFLDVRPLLVPMGAFGPNTFDERGLLGLAFHPNYQTNGLFYTYTSEPVFKPADFSTMPAGSTANHRDVVREWKAQTPSNPDTVGLPATARTLFRNDHPQFNHNAGCLNFGPDGFLYISIGDGGGADDKDGQGNPPIIGHGCSGNGQNLNTILGKLLRIDPLGNNSANGRYGIPASNPFVSVAGLDEIYAYGLRNPFRFSFDSADGTLYLPDVGQNDIEEINIGVSGGNYGWSHKEGSFFFIANGTLAAYVTDRAVAGPPGMIDPIAQYDHDDGLSVIGGFVYRGTRVAPIVGRYIFGEFARTFMNNGRLLYLDAGNAIREVHLVGQPAVGLSVMGFGQDGAGEIYLLGNSTGTPFGTTGVVQRIRLKVGDFNADGVTDVNDLLTLIGAFGPCPSPPALCVADINGDGVVDVNDLLLLIGAWG